MRKLGLVALAACGLTQSVDRTDRTGSALYAEDDVLWPMGTDGQHAPVTVCWLPLDQGAEILPPKAPVIAPYLAERKA